MVEKVFISPNRVRAYGNIVNMKTGDDFTLVNSELTVTTDTVNGAEMTVFQFEVEGGISIALTSSSSTCNVGDNVLLTATVMDRSTPVEAVEVTFKVGETVLGTDETDANGVATYTYAASTVGSFDFTASYQTSTSSVVSVSVNHSYSLSFSQSSYVATGGSATLECTLLEDNVALSGASVTVTGSDGSVYNGITNSSGIASVTVSNISAETTFTCSYQSVTDACTVTVQTYLYQSDMTTDDGNWTKSNSSGMTITYSTDGCTVKGTTSSDRTYYLSSSITLPTNFVVEYDITAYALGAYDNSTEFVVHNSKILFERTKLCIRSMDYNSDITNMDIPATPIQIKVEVNNGTISTYVNGSLFGTSSVMSSYKTIGFKTYNNRSITVKNFRISAL